MTRKRSSTSLALDATKRIHKEMRVCKSALCNVDKEMLVQWCGVIAEANKEIARLSKSVVDTEERHKVELKVITEEMRRELVDREANSARVDERVRVMAERDNGGKAGTYDRAVNSAASIHAAIGRLCGHTLNVGNGTTLLMTKVAGK